MSTHRQTTPTKSRSRFRPASALKARDVIAAASIVVLTGAGATAACIDMLDKPETETINAEPAVVSSETDTEAPVGNAPTDEGDEDEAKYEDEATEDVVDDEAMEEALEEGVDDEVLDEVVDEGMEEAKEEGAEEDVLEEDVEEMEDMAEAEDIDFDQLPPWLQECIREYLAEVNAGAEEDETAHEDGDEDTDGVDKNKHKHDDESVDKNKNKHDANTDETAPGDDAEREPVNTVDVDTQSDDTVQTDDGAQAETGMSELEMEAFALTNVEREKFGCEQPLVPNAQLAQAAGDHSADMAANDYFDHTGLDGSSVDDRMKRAGYTDGGWAENIAYNYGGTAEETVQLWMDSPPHRAQIENCDLTELALGMAESDDGRYYWTQLFGGDGR